MKIDGPIFESIKTVDDPQERCVHFYVFCFGRIGLSFQVSQRDYANARTDDEFEAIVEQRADEAALRN